MEFKMALARAAKKVKTILDTSRNPKLPKDVAHVYEDKFSLAELCVKASIAAELNHLDVLGMTKDHHEAIRGWVAKGKAVTLRFELQEERRIPIAPRSICKKGKPLSFTTTMPL